MSYESERQLQVARATLERLVDRCTTLDCLMQLASEPVQRKLRAKVDADMRRRQSVPSVDGLDAFIDDCRREHIKAVGLMSEDESRIVAVTYADAEFGDDQFTRDFAYADAQHKHATAQRICQRLYDDLGITNANTSVMLDDGPKAEARTT
jgi:hypothetical protein